MENTDESDVQAHVSIQDVAELVGYYSLKFIPVEKFDAPAGDTDGGIARAKSSSERIDRWVVQDVNRGNRDARGEGHFLYDI